MDRFGLLLGAVLVTVGVTMIAPDGELGLTVAFVLQAGVLVLALRVADASRRLRRFAVLATSAIVVVGISVDVTGVDSRRELVSLLGVLLVTAALAAIPGRLARHDTIGGSTVLGAVCIYLLLGTWFTFAFGAVGSWGGGFFVGDEPVGLASLQYFSFTTLTTVGYGDLVPATRLGRSLAMIEALLGQIYLVTVVALLVGNLGRSRRGPGGSGEQQRAVEEPGGDERR